MATASQPPPVPFEEADFFARFAPVDDTDEDRTLVVVDLAAAVAEGYVSFNDYHGGSGCFGNLEMECYADRLRQWHRRARSERVATWTLVDPVVLDARRARYRVVSGVVTDPYHAVVVLVAGDDGAIVSAYDRWDAESGAPAAHVWVR